MRKIGADSSGLPISRRTVLVGIAATIGMTVAGKCGAAGSIEEAISNPERTPNVDPLIDRPGELGKARPRRDGPDKTRGKARFAAEYRFENMTYAALAFSTIAKGRMQSIDTSDARVAPGVVLVMTHLNAPRMARPEPFLSSPTGASGSSHAVMQDDQVHWNGQPIAVVLAETQEQADHAASLVRADYERARAVTSFAEAKAAGTRVATFAQHELRFAKGDAEAQLASSPFKVDLTFSSPLQHHAQIEPHAVTLTWEGDTLRMHDCTQGVVISAATMAKVFGIEAKQVHVSSPFVGGGFGGKTLWQYHILAAAASKLAARPVRMNLTREGVFRVCGGRAPTEQRVALGADRNGRLRAIIHTGTTAKIVENAMAEPFIEATQHMYRSDAVQLEVRSTTMDMLANTFMRAPGSAVGTFPLETALDELAEALAIDPIELRLRNEPEIDPMTGKTFSQRALAQAYREGARRFGWSPRRGHRMGRREGEWLIGTGMAAAYYPYRRFPGGAARITLTSDGKAIVALAAHEMGMGTTTATAAVAAERLGLRYEDVEIVYGDNSLPGSLIAGASQQTASIGASIIAARHALLTELTKIAPPGSAWAGRSAEALITVNSGLALAEKPDQHISYRELLRRADRDRMTVEGQAAPPVETETWSMHSYGAVFCEARVNSVTGEWRASRITAVYDCGRILNAKTATSQFRGGIIMSLGMAMMEEVQFDERNGRVMNPSLAEYHVPVHLDVPDIDVAWTDIPDQYAPTGARGIGEIGMNGPSAALANAIYDATGKRVRDLPITLDKLL